MRPVVDELNVLLERTDGETISVPKADMLRWRAMLYAARNKDAGQTIKRLQDQITKLNGQVDILGRVWCDGGCKGGMNRFQDNQPTLDQIVFIVRNALRAMTWWINWSTRAGLPTVDFHTRAKAVESRLMNAINNDLLEENTRLHARITELQEAEAARVADEARAQRPLDTSHASINDEGQITSHPRPK